MATNATKKVDPAFVNIQQLTRKVTEYARKRKRKHANLYARLTSLMHGAVLGQDDALVQDVRDVINMELSALTSMLDHAAPSERS